MLVVKFGLQFYPQIITRTDDEKEQEKNPDQGCPEEYKL